MSSPQPIGEKDKLVTEPILRASAIAKSFQMGDSTIHVLKGLDLEVRSGEFLAIEGRSGSGKSTLLHILGSLESATDGQTEFQGRQYTLREPAASRRSIEWFAHWRVLLGIIILAGLTALGAFMARNRLAQMEDVSESLVARLQWIFDGIQGVLITLAAAWLGLFIYRFWSRREYRRQQNTAAALRRNEFGFIFQFYHLLPELNVVENVMFPGMVDAGWLRYLSHRSRLKKRAIQVLSELGMDHRLKHRPAQLSGGERQRVAIARALMNSPKVLYADEPTGNLDTDTGRQIMHVLEKLHKEKGQTIVMVTHDRTIARQADRVVVLAEGRLREAS